MKQKLFFVILAFLVAITAWANGTKIDGINYELDSSTKTASVTYTGLTSSFDNDYLGDITISPAVTYAGTTYSVTSIGDYAFQSCRGLTSITIPNSVTRIGWGAFDGCTGLTSITIPNSVTTIGHWAFDGCTGLTSITIPNSVTSIGYCAFQSCTGLTSIKVETGNTKYDSRDKCNAIIETNTLVVGCKATTIPNSVISIGEAAFWGCTGLTSITIPNSVTRIRGSAFRECTGLTSITIPNSVISIGDYAFAGCTGLEDIYALRTADPAAYACHTYAFRDYSATLHVPTGSKEAYASTAPWSNFASIVDDIDTGSVLTADGDVWTDGVLRFSVSSEENGEAVVSGVKDKDNLTTATIPEKVNIDDKVYSVTSIGYGAFWDCTSLTSITIPNSVTSIDSYAFQSCTSLTSITIPNSVTSIGVYVFHGCTGLTSITIPESVTSIGVGAFDGCTGLTSITIPNSVTTIGNWAFGGCTGLTNITIPSSVTSIRGSAFEGCTGLTSIKVEAGNTKYDSRDNCNAIIETESNTLIAGCMNSTIPNSVTSIGSYAFWDCTGLTSITIPNSVTSIGSYAFGDCTGLTSITIPNSVTSIGEDAFRGCTGLTSIEVAADNTQYDSREACNAIIETESNTLIAGCMNSTIPNSVTSIGKRAFYDCTGLTSITIPNSVTSIGADAFKGCTGLTSITIPSSVTSIGKRAFYDCTGLKSITVKSSDPGTYHCSTIAFRDYSATLHVPAGSKEAYASTEPWSKFASIVEEDLTAIQSLTLTPSEADQTYYNLKGQRVAKPGRGIYIVGGKKILR